MTHQIYGKRFWRLDQQLRDGPVGPLVDDFASLLLSQGYLKGYLRARFTVIAVLNRWLVRQNLSLDQLDERRIEQFIRYRSARKNLSRRGEIATLNKFIALARERGVLPVALAVPNAPTPLEEILSLYKEHLIEEHGLASSTVSRSLWQAGQFLSGFCLRSMDLSQISAQDIMSFIRQYAGEHNAGSSSLMAGSIRSFLRFLVFEGKIDSYLAECVPGVPSGKHKRLPCHLSSDELDIC
jgi:site-specific recombinase XerD